MEIYKTSNQGVEDSCKYKTNLCVSNSALFLSFDGTTYHDDITSLGDGPIDDVTKALGRKYFLPQS